MSGCWCGDHATAVSLKEEWNHSLRMRSCGPLNRQLTQCCLPSFLYQLSISILSLASALTPTQVRRSQFREVTCLEANPTAVKRKKRKKEAKQKKKNFQPDLLQGAIHRMITLGLVPAQWRRWKHRARGNRGDDKAAQT